MRNLDLDSLDIFCRVARQGGVVRAAEALHRVPSNVTTRLKQLEQRLGLALFRRQGRGLALTDDGQRLLAHAERLLALAGEAEADLRQAALQGPLRLGSLEAAAATRLPPLLAALHAQQPQLRVELQTGTTGALLQRLADWQLEAAFVSEPFTLPTGLRSRPVFDETLVLITPAGHAPVRRPSDLGATTLIAFAPGCSYRQRLLQWLGAGQVLPARGLEMSSYTAIIACVAAGTGCAIVPAAVLDGLASAASVGRHALPAAIARNRTHLVWRGPPSAALALLMERLPPLPARRSSVAG